MTRRCHADPIPICLVTGFLGGGKTTVLERLTRRLRQARVVYLVNDFASVGVDASRIEGEGRSVISIPGGSIFCRCLVTEFLGKLRHIAAEIDRPDAPIAGVVIETSGMADPSATAHMLSETRLDTRYRLARVVAVVEPGRFVKVLQTLPAVAAQVECADLVLINRCDLHEDPVIARAEREVRRIRPDADLHRTVRADADFDPFPAASGADRATQVGRIAPCRDPAFRTHTLVASSAARIDLDRMRGALTGLGEAVWRAKGRLACTQGLFDIDVSAGIFGARKTDRHAGTGVLTLILRGDDPPDLSELQAAIGTVDKGPNNALVSTHTR